ncbi:MAG: hypothetical protein ISS50_06205 [Anaerolineae bacterium]|nr:hypothetical protein [Anaerolineae bacterium]
MTERLYYLDPYRLEFEARVVERISVGAKPGVILESTCFYPTSGGQPHDEGRLNGVPVINVFEREDKAIVHVLAAELKGDLVHGVIDWETRFDHMQQHTGQHILSQAFLEILRAKTVGFHLGGGGGGQRDFAQGGGPNGSKVSEALEIAHERLLKVGI